MLLHHKKANQESATTFIKKNIKILKTETLNSDFYKYFGFEITKVRNQTLYPEQSRELLKSKILREYVEESHHKKNIEIFYN